MIQKTYQISFHFFDIGGGDAIFIRFLGKDSKWHNILIDGGYGKVYKNAFGPLIRKIVSEKEYIDHWIISHIDQDHIGAVLGFFKDNKIPEKYDAVRNFLFNYSPERVNFPNGKISVGEGIELRKYLTDFNLLNTEIINTETQSIECFGFKISILSPTPEKEAVARELWRKKETSGLIARKASQSDREKSIEELKNAEFNENKDPINGSSIAFLAEFQNIKGLLLADSHPSDIVKSLSSLGYSKDNPVEVEFMQLSHHGSKANTSSELLDIVKTKSYVLTGNGIHNKHPDKEALVRLITNESRDPEILNINFACDTYELKSIFNIDEHAFEKYKFNCSYSQLGLESSVLSYLPLTNQI